MSEEPQRRPSRGMPLRTDRILRYVVAFCAACHREHPDRPLGLVPRLSGYLAEQDGKVWLVRGCPRHGKVVTLYDEVPEILRYLEEWTAPTKVHTPDTLGNYDPVPAAYLHGLGEMQTQHTCILLEEITEQCNLRCPTCFADSSPQRSGVVPLDQVLENVDRRLAREHGRLDVLMISGGEPTVYPRLLELLERVLERDIIRILINTNGIQIARSDELLDFLTRHNDRIEIYLQFDGFKPETLRHHRNADLRRVKRESVERLSGAGIFTTLTMTAALGVNDDEIGAVVRYGLATPFVGGIAIQPQFGSGRSAALDPRNRLTHTGALARLGPQTDGLVSWPDLTALPCSHPHCCSVGYMLLDDAGQWRSLTALIGHEKLLEFLELSPDLVANRIADSGIPAQLRGVVKESLLGLLSEQSSLSHPNVGQLWRDICQNCDLGISTMLTLASSALPGGQARLRKLLAERVKRITVKPF